MSQGLSAPAGNRARTQAGLAGPGELAKPLPGCAGGDLWRGELTRLPERHSFLAGQIGAIEAELDASGAADESVPLSESIPGVGARTAEVIAVHPRDAKRFTRANRVSADAALVSRQYRSGEADRRGRVTTRGPKVLRTRRPPRRGLSRPAAGPPGVAIRYGQGRLATVADAVLEGVPPPPRRASRPPRRVAVAVVAHY